MGRYDSADDYAEWVTHGDEIVALNDDIGGHMLDLERHATGGDTRRDIDTDQAWADKHDPDDPFA